LGDDFLPIGPKVKKTVSFFVGRVALFHPPIRYLSSEESMKELDGKGGEDEPEGSIFP